MHKKENLELLKLELENLKLQKEVEKIEEERVKVQAEKNELLKVWYFKPVWWTIISTFLLGFGGFYVALETNILGIQELKVKNKKLNYSIKYSTTKLIELDKSLKSKNDDLNLLITRFKSSFLLFNDLSNSINFVVLYFIE